MVRQFTVLMLVFAMAVVVIASPLQPAKRAPKAKVDPALATAAKAFLADGCDATLWQHIYKPQRLTVVEKCISVTGTILHAKKEGDGDEHIQLTVDPEFEGLLNARNKAAQAGSLILEPICENAVTQTDAISSCRDFHSSVTVQPQGTRVKVVGSYVWDTEANHGWMEIHPVTSMERIQ